MGMESACTTSRVIEIVKYQWKAHEMTDWFRCKQLKLRIDEEDPSPQLYSIEALAEGKLVRV